MQEFTHPKMMHVYVGVDVHRKTHTASIINCFFDKLGEITFDNRLPDFPKLVAEVKKHTPKGLTPIYALEDVVSLGRELAVYLIGKGYSVKHVNASLTHEERKKRATPLKSDSFDSLCVAKVLLRELDHLPDAKLDDNLWALTELVTKRRSIVRSNARLKNQLQTYILHHYPSFRKFFAVFDCKTSLEFFETYPSPSKLKVVTVEDLGKFLKEQSNNMHDIKKAKEIFAYIEKDGDTTNEMQETRDFIVTTTINQIKENNKSIKEIESHIQILLPAFGYKLQTMKGINFVTEAALIAEIGDIQRFSTPAKLASYAGISPVQYSSGDSNVNFSNKRGNRILNQVIFFLAVSQCNEHGSKGGPVNPLFAEYYKKKLSEGKTKKQAIKCVMRRLINIIFNMMKNKSEYIEPKALPKANSE